MKRIITVVMNDFDCDYCLEEKDGDKIIAQVPYVEKDDEYENVVKHNIVECEGDKAEIVKQFFYEDSPTIIRGGTAYNIDDILFDAVELPEFVEPDVIVD